MKRAVILIAIAFALGGLAACFSITRPHKEVYFYQLDYEPPKADLTAQKSVVVRLAGFDTAPSYQSQKIIYATGNMKRKFYDYHLWTVNPGDMLSDLILRDMVVAGTYQAVVDMKSSIVPQYELEGIIEQIFEKDEGGAWFSDLTIRCVFFSYHSGKHVLFQRVYSESVNTGGKQPSDVVRAMSEAARRISLRIQKDINDSVVAYEKQKQAVPPKETPAKN